MRANWQNISTKNQPPEFPAVSFEAVDVETLAAEECFLDLKVGKYLTLKLSEMFILYFGNMILQLYDKQFSSATPPPFF